MHIGARDSLAGRRIVITGAASGIGLATAELFLGHGASVAMLDRDSAVVARASALTNAIGIECDVASAESIAHGVTEIDRTLGGLDGLVNCAGADFSGTIEETTPAEWDRLIAVNLTGPYAMTRAALPLLRQAERATIVNIASGLGLRPIVNRAAYAASKAGIIMFSSALALELAPRIRVNTVCPGLTDTPMLRDAWPGDSLDQLIARYPLKALATAEDVAYSILFFSSDQSRHMTGVAMPVNGPGG